MQELIAVGDFGGRLAGGLGRKGGGPCGGEGWAKWGRFSGGQGGGVGVGGACWIGGCASTCQPVGTIVQPKRVNVWAE